MDKVNGGKREKKPWPTKDAMEQIYAKKLWGDNNTDFYSGEGSHNSDIINPYIAVLRSFLNSIDSSLVVCDLGCGDFNVGKELVAYAKKYIAVDIVSELIKHNKKNFKAANLEFHCLDIARDELPSGDCAIVRQVLQHLSNSEIQNVVNQLSNYKYVVLTEHLPNEDFESNKDIISGQGIRLKRKSGLNLLEHPFNWKVNEEKHLLSFNLGYNRGVIVTTLYKL